jgi:glutamyl-tRNA synthetase
MTEAKPVRVRIAPSPTGRTHLATGRVALYNYAFARQHGGHFILRIEDTDQKRYVPGAEEDLMRSLGWLGLDWDEGPGVGGPYGPYTQTARREIYQEHARRLIERGQAYTCFCTPDRLEQARREQQAGKENPHYDRTCRMIEPEEAARRVRLGEAHTIRFKMPNEGSITVHDYLRGDITVENRNLDDFILVKSDGLAVYHLAAMVDDHLMEISHVLRGSEWLSTLPLHAHIIRAFGWEQPVFAHLSIFLKPSGKGKMSKRDTAQAMQDGHSIFIGDMAELGFLPEAVINWMALMGWSYDDHTEFFTLRDIIDKFSLDKLNPSPAAINFAKLDHFNGLHIRSLAPQDLAQRVKPFFMASGYSSDDDKLLRIAPLIQQRMVTLDDAVPMAGFFFQDQIQPKPEELVGKYMTPAASVKATCRALEILQSLPVINPETAEEPLRQLAEELDLKPGQLFGILRVAVTGQPVSPPLFESMAIIGKEKVLERVQKAIRILEAMD